MKERDKQIIENFIVWLREQENGIDLLHNADDCINEYENELLDQTDEEE